MMAACLMFSAQNGQSLLNPVWVGLVVGWVDGSSATHMSPKTPIANPARTQPITLRFLLDATIPQKIGQKMNHKTAMNSMGCIPGVWCRPQLTTARFGCK